MKKMILAAAVLAASAMGVNAQQFQFAPQVQYLPQVESPKLVTRDICATNPTLNVCRDRAALQLRQRIPIPGQAAKPGAAQCSAMAECETLPYAGCASGLACRNERATGRANTWTCQPTACGSAQTPNKCVLQGVEFPGWVDAQGVTHCEYAG